jgi:hypothetical protein
MPLSEPGGFFVQGNTNAIIGNTSGENNTGNNVFFVGQDAGDDNIADNIVGIGTQAAGNFNEAPNVIVIGNGNLTNGMLSAADGSVFIGHGILPDQPRTANFEQMVVIGSGLGLITSTFTRNCVFIGTNIATVANTNLQSNVSVGAESASRANLNTHANSVGVGYRAGRGTGTASQSFNGNTAVGSRAMENTFSGQNTVAIGNNAMGDGTVTANINTCVGIGAGEDLTSGLSNIVLGAYTVGVGHSTQDSMVMIGNQQFIGAGEQHLLLGNSIDKSGALTLNGHIFIGNHAGASGGLIAGIAYFVLEGGTSTLGTPDTKIPFLLGDLDAANLMLGDHHNAVSGARVDGNLGDGTNTWIQQDADAGGGGGGAITGALTNSIAMFYDGSVGSGTYLCRLPSGATVALAHNAAAGAVVPTRPVEPTDADTGVGWRSADSGTLAAGGQECMNFAEAGAAPLVAFYGTTAIALQTGVAVTSIGIHAALVALGLITA